MGKNAARQTDPHHCPATDPSPHTGGPILAPCFPRVMIGGQAAARVTDTAQCTGATDTITTGVRSVKIGGLDAAIMCSRPVHAGQVQRGCPSVWLAPSNFAVQSGANRVPTEAEYNDILDALNDGRDQDAVDLTVQHYGLDVSNATAVTYDPTIPSNVLGRCNTSGHIRVGPDARVSPEWIASTIVHESTHANQATLLGGGGWGASGSERRMYWDVVAYDTEMAEAHNTGIDQDDYYMQTRIDQRSAFLNGLGEGGIAAFCAGASSR